MTDAVVVLGATGRLGPAVVTALESHGLRVLRAGRADVEISGFDATDPSWHRPVRWRDVLPAERHKIVAVVNLVTSGTNAEAVGAGAVRATAALAEAAGTPTSIHVGSVSEFRTGRLSSYAAGKVAARSEARARSVGVVLTLGVVPRPVGDPYDAAVRWFAARIPAMAGLRLDVSTPSEVGTAIARLIDVDWSSLGLDRPVEITLAGTTRTLGEIVGAVSVARWYSGLLVRLLAVLPRPGGVRWSRLVSLARQATGSTPGHYATRPPAGSTELLSGDWRLLRYADLPQLWLQPRVSTEVTP